MPISTTTWKYCFKPDCSLGSSELIKDVAAEFAVSNYVGPMLDVGDVMTYSNQTKLKYFYLWLQWTPSLL